MKISKIIFISLLSIIAFYILISILYIRIYGYRKDDKTYFTVKEQVLPIIKVLRAINCKNIEILISDSTLIKSTWHKDSIIPNEIFTVKNDTLFLADIKGSVMIKIYTSDSLRNILLKETDVTIESVTSQHLDINMDKSELYIHLADSVKYSMKTLKIRANNKSSIRSSSFKTDLLEVKLQNSTAYLSLLAKTLSGTLSDSSRISIPQPNEILMKSDTTSNIYVYNWD